MNLKKKNQTRRTISANKKNKKTDKGDPTLPSKEKPSYNGENVSGDSCSHKIIKIEKTEPLHQK